MKIEYLIRNTKHVNPWISFHWNIDDEKKEAEILNQRREGSGVLLFPFLFFIFHLLFAPIRPLPDSFFRYPRV